jgi:hypothetical protein
MYVLEAKPISITCASINLLSFTLSRGYLVIDFLACVRLLFKQDYGTAIREST